ncbi:zinc finger protein 862-like [Gigantopelta aegis]|uniref:zinc finger protein 862-like n=1 Tax=Gigantopelta aegis TaxID=1735272 RepID=UPI001B88E74F|nr:zinc finger protein 862-like [Gigantopelta aegis]
MSLLTDTGSSPAKKKVKVQCFQLAWLKQFKWLICDDGGLMQCTTCTLHKMKNSFVNPGSKNYRMSALTDHVKSRDHLTAEGLQTIKSQKLIESIVIKSTAIADDSMTTLIRNSYLLAFEDLPLEKYESLNRNSRLTGSIITTSMYQDRRTATELITIASDIIRESIIEDLKSSKAIGIMVDESTDLETEKHLIIYATYVKEGSTCVRYVQLLKLTSCDAVSLTAKIVSFFQGNEIDMKKVFGFGSDGAAVMLGKEGGVATLLKVYSPYLVEMHCVAHRLALAVVDSAKVVKEIKWMESILSMLCGCFRRSPKRLMQLAMWQDFLDDPKNQASTSTSSPMTNALTNVRRTLPSLLKMLEEDRDDDVTAEALFCKLSSYKFVYLLHLCCDIFDQIARLVKFLQRRDLVYAEINPAVTLVADTFHMWYLSDDAMGGPLLREFVSNVDCSEPVFAGISLTMSKQDAGLLKLQQNIANVMTTNVTSRFPDMELRDSMSILDPQNLPCNNLSSYGVSELSMLSKHFDGAVNPTELVSEWEWFKVYTKRNHRQATPTDLLKDAALVNLINISCVLPVSSVECERGFSRQNLIKTRLRTAMTLETLDCLMRISIEGDDIEQFDPAPVLSRWKCRHS